MNKIPIFIKYIFHVNTRDYYVIDLRIRCNIKHFDKN